MRDTPLILYIEDNYDNRKLVARVLNAAGFKVYGVSDGKTGLDFVEKQKPDLVLLDLNLPDIDGYSVASHIREQKHLTLPIVALTASVMQSDVDKSFAVGCTGFIQKPINVDQLPDQIRSFLA